ncbi:MAG TPA: response regulator, partial [Syntrophales bacterium]|nr:response regulator [Syntrophales bacterium]
MKTKKRHCKQTEEFQEENSSPILVVDDSVEILNLLTDILTIGNYRVRIASSGQAALESIADEIPSLILLDIKMPDMDGYELCHRLKNDERTINIPVIFISGFDDIANKIQGFNSGGVDFIPKPFQSEEVLARIKIHLELRHLQEQLELQNIHLQKEVKERLRIEEELKKHKTNLEELVAERTADLQREICKRKKVEELYTTLTENSLAAIFIIQDGKFRFINTNAIAYAGYSAEELIGQNSYQIVHPEDRERLKSISRSMVRGENTTPYEFRMVTKQGQIRWITQILCPVQYEGKPAILGNAIDITERKEL